MESPGNANLVRQTEKDETARAALKVWTPPVLESLGGEEDVLAGGSLASDGDGPGTAS